MKKKSIVTEDMRHCLICNRIADAVHHLLSGSQRGCADRDGLIVALCNEDHNIFEDSNPRLSDGRIKPLGQSCDFHHCRKMELLGKMIGQLAWEKNFYKELCLKHNVLYEDHDYARDAFLRAYGKKYL